MEKLFAFLTLLLFLQPLHADSAAIFIYHRFGESKYPSTNIKVEQFQNHLDYLEKNDFNVCPLSKIVDHMIFKIEIPSKTVAITIDDAYKSVYEKAYPLLKKKKYPFTVFVNTSAISPEPNNYMDWSDMREMASNGAEFANHSLTHDYILPLKGESRNEWQTRIKKEIVGAQKELQKELGKNTNESPRLFSYPYGEYTAETAEYVKSLGYIGIAQRSGAVDLDTDLKDISRFAMSEVFGNMDSFILKANTLALPVEKKLPDETIIKANNPPKLVLKLKHPVKNMNCFVASGEKIKIKWLSDTEAEIQANKALKPPRDRYTCTARFNKDRWYWHSHLWIIKK